MNGSCLKDTMPLPENAFKDFHDLYICDKMYVAVIKMGFDMYPGMHAHDGYEFIMPITDMPYICIDGKLVSCPKHKFLPINPWQSHGVAQKMEKIRFADVVIDRIYMEEIYYSLCGKKLNRLKNKAVDLDFEIKNILKKFIDEAKSAGLGRDMVLQSLCCQFSIEVIRKVCNDNAEDNPKVDDINKKKVEKVAGYMNDCYSKDCSLDCLAEMAGMSKYHLIRFFRQIMGKSPYDYLIDIRIEKAKKLLMNRDISVADIAAKCGFNHASHFSYVFRKRIGISPGRFREMLRL
ncbi:MAG TPA: helix-turn-helix transcriptional regulator [Bacillota bacterium]|nr:helix-turn-helix transcriptional regulator [Bacillota bacterium]